jgi:polysaccharide pyruvyl transferase WcaK-like protein
MSKLLKVVVLNDTRSEHHHGCSRVMNCIDHYLKDCSSAVVYSAVSDNWQQSEKLKRKIVGADLVIVNGEGTIHHNSSSGLALVKVAQFAKKYGVKSYLINMTYQANDSSYKKYLVDFERIFVRESYSKAELTGLGIDSEIVPDLTFSVIPDNYENLNAENILITCSVKSHVTIALEEKFPPDNNVIFSSIFNQNKATVENITASTRLLNIMKNNTPSQMVKKIISGVTARVSTTEKINWQTQYTHPEYADFLAQAKIVICGRFHAMTICMNQGTNFLAIESNSHKVSGTLTDIGLDINRFLVTPNVLTKDFVLNFEMTENEHQLVKAYADKAKAEISTMFEQILA